LPRFSRFSINTAEKFVGPKNPPDLINGPLSGVGLEATSTCKPPEAERLEALGVASILDLALSLSPSLSLSPEPLEGVGGRIGFLLPSGTGRVIGAVK